MNNERNYRELKEELEMTKDRMRFLSSVLEQSTEGIAVADIDGHLLFVNRAFATMHGFVPEELVGKHLSVFHTPDQMPSVEAAGRQISDTGEFKGEIRHVRRDGTVFPTMMHNSLFRDDAGNPIGLIGTLRDITERKDLEAQLLQAQKMESVGRLAGGVAHDFNNLLTVILGHTELALDKVRPGDPIHADLQEVFKTAERSASVIRQLLAFARKQTIKPRALNLNDTLEGMLNMLGHLIGEDIELVWLPKSELWRVNMDPSQIDQLLANLCVNARDAISGVGKVIVETENVVLDKEYCARHAGFVPGEYVMLAVSDNGCGMEKEILDKVFEPFFTTKQLDNGTGLGLSTVYGVVKQHQGFINVYSEPGNGTTFKIYIPRHMEDIEAGPEESTDKIPQGHGETIFIVEDEVLVLEVGKKILTKLGYHTLTAGTPDEAMKMIRRYPGKVHLLISDVVMPEMSGKDLAEQMFKIRPNIRVLFMSGYSTSAIPHHWVLDKEAHFIQKPLFTESLARKVREALETEH